MILTLIAGLCIGSVFSLDGLKNTVIVYMVLYAMQKYCEIGRRFNPFIFAFTIFLAMYFLALEANAFLNRYFPKRLTPSNVFNSGGMDR